MAANNQKEPMWCIIQSGDMKKVEGAISQGYPLNELDSYGFAPLHYATQKTPTTVEILRFLLEKGADINIRSGTNGNTPLMEAVGNECEEAIHCLLVNNADPNIWNMHRQTPFDMYCSNCPVDIMTVAFFLGRGARANSSKGKEWVGKLNILRDSPSVQYLQMYVSDLQKQVNEMRQFLQSRFDYMPQSTFRDDIKKDSGELSGELKKKQ